MQVMKRVGLWGGIIILFAVAVWGLIAFVNSNKPSNVLSSQATDLVSIRKDDIVFGDPKLAKAVLIEYADFQCPACAFYQPWVRELKKDFGSRLLVVYRFFPLSQHKNAIPSSRAALAAGIQNKFWEMHDLIYENQESWANSANAKEIFTDYAKKLNLDIDKFNLDFEAQSTKDFINSELNEGVRIGIKATPTFFVNGVKIQNPRSLDEFKTLIQDAIGKK